MLNNAVTSCSKHSKYATPYRTTEAPNKETKRAYRWTTDVKCALVRWWILNLLLTAFNFFKSSALTSEKGALVRFYIKASPLSLLSGLHMNPRNGSIYRLKSCAT